MIGWGAVSVKRSQPIRVRWLGLFVPLMGQGRLIPDAIVKKYCERKKNAATGLPSGARQLSCGQSGNPHGGGEDHYSTDHLLKKVRYQIRIFWASFLVTYSVVGLTKTGRLSKANHSTLSHTMACSPKTAVPFNCQTFRWLVQESRSFPASHTVSHPEHEEVYVGGRDCQANS